MDFDELKKIRSAKLDCIVMPNGEVLCLGKTIGYKEEFKGFLRYD